MITLTLDLPVDLLDKATEKGLLSSPAIESYIRRTLRESAADTVYPPGFPEGLKGKVSPKLYGKGIINGDIIGPFSDEWENGY
jgi:hypothetical protein